MNDHHDDNHHEHDRHHEHNPHHEYGEIPNGLHLNPD